MNCWVINTICKERKTIACLGTKSANRNAAGYRKITLEINLNRSGRLEISSNFCYNSKRTRRTSKYFLWSKRVHLEGQRSKFYQKNSIKEKEANLTRCRNIGVEIQVKVSFSCQHIIAIIIFPY